MPDTSMLTLIGLLTLAMVGPMMTIHIPRLRIPTAVLEILIGACIGKSGLGLFLPNALLHHLSDLGLLFLMFLAGTEVQIGNSNQGRKGSSVIAACSFLLTLALSTVCSWWLTRETLGPSTWMMALLFTTTSVGIVVPIVRENGLTQTAYGQTLLQAALIADIATLLLLSFVITSVAPGQAEKPWIPLLALFGWGIALYLLAKPLQTWIYKARNQLPSAQIGIRASLSILGATLFVTYQLHLELILGAFAAGLILSLVAKGRHQVLHDKLEGIGYGFLFPLFFLSLGISFDLSRVKSEDTAILIPMILGCAYLVKVIGAIPFKLRFSGRQTLQAGVLLSTRFTLVIAVSSVGVKLGLISSSINEALVIVSICTVLLSPLLFNGWQKTLQQ